MDSFLTEVRSFRLLICHAEISKYTKFQRYSPQARKNLGGNVTIGKFGVPYFQELQARIFMKIRQDKLICGGRFFGLK